MTSSVKRKSGPRGSSPRVKKQPGRDAVAPATRTCGGGGAELTVLVRWWSSGFLGPSIRCVVELRRRTEGQGEVRHVGGVKSWWRSWSPAVVLGSDSGATRARVEGCCFGETPGGEAVLLRCLAGALVSRDGRSMAAQGCGVSAEQDVRRLGFWGGGGVE